MVILKNETGVVSVTVNLPKVNMFQVKLTKTDTLSITCRHTESHM